MSKYDIQRRIDRYNEYIQDKDYIVLLNEDSYRLMIKECLEFRDGVVACPSNCNEYHNPSILFNKIEVFKLDKVVIEADVKWAQVAPTDDARVAISEAGIDLDAVGKSVDIEIKMLMSLQGIFNA